MLGARWVAAQPDGSLSDAAQSALGTIAAASPADRVARFDDVSIWPVVVKADVERSPRLHRPSNDRSARHRRQVAVSFAARQQGQARVINTTRVERA